MEEGVFIRDLVLLIAMAAAAAALFERLRLPVIAGFLVIGALVGPGGLGLVADVEQVQALAEFGVVFLLFEIGLELPLERVRQLWRSAAVAGALQVALTVALVAGLSVVFGLTPARALVLGGLVAMSSTALVIGALSARGEMNAPHGQLSLGILLFQDLCIVPFLLIVPLLAESTGGVSTGALLSLVRSIAALAVLVVVTRFVLPQLLDRVVQGRSREVFTLVAFLVVLGTAWVAEEIGLTLAVGAFVGGLVLSASPYAHQLFAEVLPLRGVLLGLFFTAVGMLLDPRAALEGWSAVLGYVAFVVVIKSAIVAAVVTLVLRQGLRIGIITGLGLAQTGEFSFVLASAAVAAGLLEDVLHQVFLVGSIVTLIATPMLIRVAPGIAGRIVGEGAEHEPEASEPERYHDHVVLLGFGFGGQTVARILAARGVPYVGSDSNATSIEEMRRRGESVVYGDVTRRALLQRIGIERARLVVITVSDAIASREAVRLARNLAPEVPIVVRTRFLLEVDRLYQVGASVVVVEEFESTLQMVTQVLRQFGIPDTAVSHFTDELREEGYEPLRRPGYALDPWLGEILEEETTEWVEVMQEPPEAATLASLGVRARTGCSILAIEHGDIRISNPVPTTELRRGYRLLAFGSATQVEQLVTLLRFDPGAG